METKRIRIVGDAIMWMEPAAPGQKRGTHRGEFRGWVGEVPVEVADKAVAAKSAVEVGEGEEDTPPAAELTTPNFDSDTIHSQSVATIVAYLNQLRGEARSSEALRISELELTREGGPRATLIQTLDKIVDSATN